MAKPSSEVVSAAQSLIDHGALFVLSSGKRTNDFNWSRPDGTPGNSDRDRVILESRTKKVRPHFTATEAAEWLTRKGKREVGVLVSTVDDGLCVVDYDEGVESAGALSELIGHPMVITTSTGGSGKHAWFRWPADSEGVFTKKTGVRLPGLVGERQPVKADVVFSNGIVCEGAEGLVAVAEAVANTSDNAGRMGNGVWQVLARLADAKDPLHEAFAGVEALVDGTSHNTLLSVVGKALQGDLGQWGPEGFVAKLLEAHAVSRWPEDGNWVRDARRVVSDIAKKAKGEWDNRFAHFARHLPPGVSAKVSGGATTPLAAQVLASAKAATKRKRRVLVPGGMDAEGLSNALAGMGLEVATLEDQGGVVGFRAKGATAWQPLDTTERTSIMGALQNRYGVERTDGRTGKTSVVPFKLTVQDFQEHVAEVAGATRVNILGDYLDTCPKFGDPKEAYRVLQDEFATRLWDIRGVAAEIARVAFPALLIGAVGRHYEPGAKFDSMTILCSKPGLGKTTFVHNLLPDSLEFAGKVQVGFTYGHRNEDEDDKMNKLVGASFVDFSELSPTGIDLERLKGFVDRRVDTFRRKYGVVSKPHPRTCVLTATSNRPDPLPHDPAGHRKFWIVWLSGMSPECGAEEDTADFVCRFFEEHRKRLWGAAVACWFGFERKGSVHPKLVMPRALWGKVTDEAGEGSAVPEHVREMMDSLARVPECLDWLMPEELVQMTGRAKVVHDDYVPSPGWLLNAARTAVDSVPGWERASNSVVDWLGVESRPRHFRREGSEPGRRRVKDEETLRGRRDLLGIRDPRGGGGDGGKKGHYPFEGMGQ